MLSSITVHVRPRHHAMSAFVHDAADAVKLAIVEALPCVVAIDYDPVDMEIVATNAEGRSFFWEQKTPEAVARFAYEPTREPFSFVLQVPEGLLRPGGAGSTIREVTRNIFG